MQMTMMRILTPKRIPREKLLPPLQDLEAGEERPVATSKAWSLSRPTERFVRRILCCWLAYPDPPQPQRTPDGGSWPSTSWGLSKAQAQDLWLEYQATAEYRESDTSRDFVQKFVKPRTAGTGMGLSLLVNQRQPRRVNLMISHAWDEHAGRFFEDIAKLVRDDENMFVCFFAIYQNQDGCGPSIGAQLGGSINDGPFADIIHSLRPERKTRTPAKGRMLVVTNEEIALYTRMWCIWEVYCALKNKLPITYSQRGRLYESAEATSRDARCGPPNSPLNSDERVIRRHIEKMPVMSDRERNLLRYFIVAALVGFWFLLHELGQDENTSVYVYDSLTVALTFLLVALWLFISRICKGDGYNRLDSFVRLAVPDSRH